MRGKITALVAAAAAAVGAAGAAKWARGRKGEDQVREPAAAGSADAVAADAKPVAATPAAQAAVGPDSSGADDLTAIKGLGKVKAAKLVAAGVTTYAQVATWSDDDIAEYGLETNTSPGQIKREDWVGQAQALLRE